MAVIRHLGFVMRVFVWTTHEEYLVVLIVVQSLVGIGCEVFKICEFQCRPNASLARKYRFTPLLLVLGVKMREMETYAVLSL